MKDERTEALRREWRERLARVLEPMLERVQEGSDWEDELAVPPPEPEPVAPATEPPGRRINPTWTRRHRR